MPRYKVLKTGFIHNRLYHPEGEGKRNTVITDKPLKPTPSWLEAIKEETAAAKKKRLAAEKAAAEDNAEKAESDKIETDEVNFLKDGEQANTVETL